MVFSAFILGLGCFLIDFQNFKGENFIGERQVEARVSAVLNTNYNQRVLLTNVKINGQEQANIILTIYDGYLSIGNQIEFTTKINTIEPFEFGKFASIAYKNKAPYFASINIDNIQSIKQGKLTLTEKIRKNTKELLLQNMDSEIAELAYSTLFGDKSELSTEISTAFTKSGIAHVLSVSGLHVGVLVMALNFVFKKLRLKNWIILLFIAIFLAFYSFLCDFAPSVLRSSLMALVFLSAGLFGRQYDLLNSLSISGLLILLFKPLFLFDIGFQLSFMSVFAIALFHRPLTNFLTKRAKLPHFISSSLALTIGVQVGILPLIANYFGEVSILSPLTNLLTVPIFEFTYILLFAVIITSLLFPFMAYLLSVCQTLLELVVQISNYISSISFANIQLFNVSTTGLILFFLGAFILSGFVMLKPKTKFQVLNFVLVLCLLLGLINSMPKNYNNLTIFQANPSGQSYSLIISPQGEKLLIGNFENTEPVVRFLNRVKIDKIEYVLSLDEIDQNNELYNQFVNKYSVKQTIYFGSQRDLNSFSLKYINPLPNTNVLIIKVYGYKIAYLPQTLTITEQENLIYLVEQNSINIVINEHNLTNSDFADFCINPTNLKTPNSTYTNLNNWYLEIKHGILKKVRRINWNLQIFQNT